MEVSNTTGSQSHKIQSVPQPKENICVGLLGRVFTPFIDILYIFFLTNIIRHIVFFLSLHMLFEKACPIFEFSDSIFFYVFILVAYVIFSFISYIIFGTTLSKYIFGYRLIVSSGAKPPIGKIILRELIGKLFIISSILLAFIGFYQLISYSGILSHITIIPFIIISIILLAICIFSLYIIPFFFTTEKQFLHDVISGTFIISVGSSKMRILKLFTLSIIIPFMVIILQYLINMHSLTTIYSQEQNEKDLCYFGYKYPGINNDSALALDPSLSKVLSTLLESYPKTIDILKEKLSERDPDFVITSISTANASEYKFQVYLPQSKSVYQYNVHKNGTEYVVVVSGENVYHNVEYDSFYTRLSEDKRIPKSDLKKVIDVCLANIWKKNELSFVSCNYSLSPTFSFEQENYWNCRFKKKEDLINDYICLVGANSGIYKEWQRQNQLKFLNNM